MKFRNTGAEKSTITREVTDFLDKTDNIFKAVSVMAKRSSQINSKMKEELMYKLEEFALNQEQLDEVFENQEQIAVSKFFESLPKPWSIAMKELLNDEIYMRNTDEEVDESTLKDYDCAVVADKGTMSKCLGMEEGDEATDDLGITMGEYEGTKAIIYDRNGKQIGVQTARSKTGPGGSMQDSVAYHKDFQKCLARETKLQGKCG